MRTTAVVQEPDLANLCDVLDLGLTALALLDN